MATGWQHFSHDADLGVRGTGDTREQAFAQVALALTAAVTDIASIVAATPVLIGGSMGTASYSLAGHWGSKAFASACHSAGRAMSHNEVLRRWKGRAIVAELARRGILIRSPSLQGGAEEAPDAYKDVSAIVHASARAGLACLVAKLAPVICVKG